MLLQNRYEYNPLTDFIADGSAARVYIAFDTQTDKPVIVKFYHDLSVEHQTFQNNMERIKQLHHPNLTQLHDYFVMETINYLGQITEVKVGIWEYIPNGVLQLPMNDPLTENTLRGIITGLQYLYANGCSHLDLQLDNILISTNEQVKLNNYEITNTTPQLQPNVAADLKGIGTVLHQYCTGEMPKDNLPESLQASGIREVYAVIIQDCLTQKAKSVEEVLTTLNEYERNKRFAEVLPLQTKQAQTRYVFEMDDDLLEDTNHSWIFKAFDNLLDETITLEVFKQEPTVALLQNIDKSKYAYLFKLNLPDDSETYKTALAGIVLPKPQPGANLQQPETELLPIPLTETDNTTAHTGDTAVIEMSEIEIAPPEEPETEKPEKSTATYEEPATDLVEPPAEQTVNQTTDIIHELSNETVETITETTAEVNDLIEEVTPQTEEEETENNSIVVISVQDHLETNPEAGSPQPDSYNVAIEHVAENKIAEVEANTALENTGLSFTDLPDLPEEDSTPLQNSEEAVNSMEFETIDLTETGENPDDLAINTEVIVQKAIDEVNADFGKNIQELETMQKELETSISINLGDTGIQENTGSIAPTGLIKVEALSELHKDIETSENELAEEEHPDAHKDKYMDIAISTLKDDDAPATDTQFFEKEAMEQVQKDLEKLLSEGDDDVA